MKRNAAGIYRDLLGSHSLDLSCGIPIWVMEGVQQDPNMLPSRANSKASPVHLVLIGWKVLSVSHGNFCLSVFSGVSVCEFCWKHGAETEMGQIFLLSLLPSATSDHCCHGCF